MTTLIPVAGHVDQRSLGHFDDTIRRRAANHIGYHGSAQAALERAEALLQRGFLARWGSLQDKEEHLAVIAVLQGWADSLTSSHNHPIASSQRGGGDHENP